jgi:hypothetical protein
MKIKKWNRTGEGGQVRATKPGSGSGPVEWKSDYDLVE